MPDTHSHSHSHSHTHTDTHTHTHTHAHTHTSLSHIQSLLIPNPTISDLKCQHTHTHTHTHTQTHLGTCSSVACAADMRSVLIGGVLMNKTEALESGPGSPLSVPVATISCPFIAAKLPRSL